MLHSMVYVQPPGQQAAHRVGNRTSQRFTLNTLEVWHGVQTDSMEVGRWSSSLVSQLRAKQDKSPLCSTGLVSSALCPQNQIPPNWIYSPIHPNYSPSLQCTSHRTTFGRQPRFLTESPMLASVPSGSALPPSYHLVLLQLLGSRDWDDL